MKFIILAAFGLSQCTDVLAGVQPSDDTLDSGIDVDLPPLGDGLTGETTENLLTPVDVTDRGSVDGDDIFYDALSDNDWAHATPDDDSTSPSGQRFPSPNDDNVHRKPEDQPSDSGIGLEFDDDDDVNIKPEGEAVDPVVASDSDDVYTDAVDLLEIQEGLYGEVIVDRGSAPEGKLQVHLPESAKLTWDPSQLSLGGVDKQQEKKVYYLAVPVDAVPDDKGFLLKIDGFPTETPTKVEIFPGHLSAAANMISRAVHSELSLFTEIDSEQVGRRG
eukprot:GEMP01027072.1.p1 GENE.GEMP01027072.1~~GEMP01027072.1.p1  ORF type:complete len:275 (+),score=59.24 GEMP01027072.1:134-958(+)